MVLTEEDLLQKAATLNRRKYPLLGKELKVQTDTANTAKKMKFSIKDLFSKFDQIHSFLRIWSHLLKKPLMENFIFSVVKETVPRIRQSFHVLKK